jgi:hypothetical protein
MVRSIQRRREDQAQRRSMFLSSLLSCLSPIPLFPCPLPSIPSFPIPHSPATPLPRHPLTLPATGPPPCRPPRPKIPIQLRRVPQQQDRLPALRRTRTITSLRTWRPYISLWRCWIAFLGMCASWTWCSIFIRYVVCVFLFG